MRSSLSQPLIQVEHLSKKFCRESGRTEGYGLRDLARALLGKPVPWTLRRGEFWSLSDVSLELRPGEALAVLGANGAGKSTLLRILAGLLKPDRGEVRVSGRVSPLLDLGAGLEPLLTGRENIEQVAAFNGFGRMETKSFTERVVDFAQLGDSLDARLQTYSTGMRARLGYALATEVRPDILLVDEVLAVGDLAFQRKCLDQMRKFLSNGGALVLVSHNPYQTQTICGRGIVLEHGKLIFSGSAVDAVHRSIRPQLPTTQQTDPPIGIARIESLSATANDGGPWRRGQPCNLHLRCRADEPADVQWGFSIWSEDGWMCITSVWDQRSRSISAGAFELACTLPELRLAGGIYLIRAMLIDPATSQPLATIGHSQGGIAVEVATEPGLIVNGQLAHRQLLEMKVEWHA